MKRYFLCIISFCLVNLIASCSDSPDPPPENNYSPIARIKLDNSTIELGQSVNVSALESSDPDDDALYYEWSITDGDGLESPLSNKHSGSFDFTPEEFGNYQVTLTVSDAEHTSEAVNATIAVEPNSQSFPVAVASGGSNNKVGQTHWFSAEKSTSGVGQLLSYHWAFKSKPALSNSSIGDETSLQAYFIADKTGTYEILLTVTNVENQLTAQNDFTVNIDGLLTNSPPQAVISVPRVNYAVNEIVKLNGGNSYDSDNDQLSYDWRFEQTPIASNAQIIADSSQFIEFLADTEGEYEVILTVSDGQLTSEQKQIIHVTHQNVTPIADAGPDQIAILGLPLELNGAASSDADGEELQFQWSLVSRPASSSYNALSEPKLVDSSILSLVPAVVGEFVFALEVYDGIEHSLVDQVRIIVTDNQRPVAKLPEDIIVNYAEMATIFDSGSYDPEGLSLSYSWLLSQAPEGHDGTLTDNNLAFALLDITTPGTYTVQLTVNDGIQDSIPETTNIVYTPEVWKELIVTGQLVDELGIPLVDIEIGGILQAKVYSDSTGYFEVLLTSKEQDARLEYLRFLGDNIPATFLSIPETSEQALNLGVVKVPVLQRLDVSLQACQGYTGPQKLLAYFYQLNSGFDNMQFPKVNSVELDIDQEPVQISLPATGEIHVRPSPQVQVEFSVNDDLPFFTHYYQTDDTQVDPLVIHVCN